MVIWWIKQSLKKRSGKLYDCYLYFLLQNIIIFNQKIGRYFFLRTVHNNFFTYTNSLNQQILNI